MSWTAAIENRFGLVERVPHPIEWLSDNGSAYTASTLAFAQSAGLDPCTTPVQSPEPNGMAEAFIKTFAGDYVYFHCPDSAPIVLGQLPGWFTDYNEVHPHKGLKIRSPQEYRKCLNATARCPS